MSRFVNEVMLARNLALSWVMLRNDFISWYQSQSSFTRKNLDLLKNRRQLEMIEIMVFELNVTYKSFFIWPRPSDFSIKKIRIPETGFPDSGFSDPELKI